MTMRYRELRIGRLILAVNPGRFLFPSWGIILERWRITLKLGRTRVSGHWLPR
jgi:hypothetical protein